MPRAARPRSPAEIAARAANSAFAAWSHGRSSPSYSCAAAVGELQRLLPLAVVRDDVGEVVGAAGLAGRRRRRASSVAAAMCRRAGSRWPVDASIQAASSSAVARSRGRRAVAGGVERGEDALRAAAVAEDDPGPAEPVGDLEPSQRVVRRAPGQRGVDVGALGPREREVLGLAARCARPPSTRRPASANHAACAAKRALGQPRLGQRLERERADAVEQPVAAAARPTITSERLASRPTTSIAAAAGTSSAPSTDSDRRERRAAGERGQRPQAALVVGEQQVVAPPDRRPERPAALGLAAGRVAQHGEAVVEAAGDLLDRQRLRARGGELDRQRQAVERPAQLAHLRRGSPGARLARQGEQLDRVVERSGASSNTASPSSSSGTWLVHRIRSGGAASRRRSASAAAASTTCSQLSRISTAAVRRSRSMQRRLAADDVERGDRPCRARRPRSARSRAGPARREPSVSVRPVAIATSAVLPIPPGPTTSTSRWRASRSRSAAISPSRADELGRQRRQVARRGRGRATSVLRRGSAARAPAAAGRGRGRARRPGARGPAGTPRARRPGGRRGRAR